MEAKNILITGVAGFIGSHVAELLLNQGYNVIGIDNFDPFYDRLVKINNLTILSQYQGFSFQELDIRNFGNLKLLTKAIDAVIHLAAKAGVLPSINNSDDYIQSNINGTLNLLRWMKDVQVKKMVFASSSSIYGNDSMIPYREDLPVDHPISPYAFTKRSCELLNYTYHHLYNLDILNLRLFTVYGPRQRPDLAIHKFFKLISEKEEICVYGNGRTARDYTFVSDTAEGIVSALKYILRNEKIYDIINLGNNSPVMLLDLIEAIGEVVGVEPRLKFLPMQPGDVEITFADISKASEKLNYRPKITLKEGLEKFSEWFQNKDLVPAGICVA